MREEVRRMIESIYKFLERDDLEVSYREEVEGEFKKSIAPSRIARIKTILAPDGRKVTISITELYSDDAAVQYKEIMVEISQNWMEPKRAIAFLYTDDLGAPSYSDPELYREINHIWDIVG